MQEGTSNIGRDEQAQPRRMRRDDPQVYQIYGLTKEDVENPGRALLSGGVKKMVMIQRYMALPVEWGGESRQECLPHQGNQPPMWQSLTGLFPDAERQMNPDRRDRALEELVEVVLELLRKELEQAKEKASPYHTPNWDPLLKICYYLGISRAHLSRLSKEATGLAAHELVDVLRVKIVKDKMKEDALKYLAALGRAQEQLPAPMDIWRALKESRRGPTFHRGTFALGFGFPNYNRFYRACVFFFQMAPQQLEFLAIEEALVEMKNENGKVKNEGAGVPEEGATATAPAESATPTATESGVERLSQLAWSEMKTRHVQFFTTVSERLWAEAG